MPSATEIVFALGGQDRLVGVTDFCDWPPAARRKRRVGGMVAPSLEAIAALRPDLVVATDEGNSPATFDQLARLRIPAFVVRARRPDGVMDLIRRLGELRLPGDRGQAPDDPAPPGPRGLAGREPVTRKGRGLAGAVVIAAIRRGAAHRYGVPATGPGRAVARATREALVPAIARWKAEHPASS